MITITNFLSPQVARSGDPHYQSRATALGQSLMTHILSMEFDRESAQYSDGGGIRCSDTRPEITAVACSPEDEFGAEESDITLYNDVDDFLGCWNPGGTGGCKNLNTLLRQSSTTYTNFRIDIAVTYSSAFATHTIKEVEMTITASNQHPIKLSAYKGNY
ncbi:MSHA biogenesis protein MshD [Vibrio sonorensis]|uniref:MSHA biogenesis protein MshD n=1 Tax=Vibrio sonorensis TaxID=1004316 RepID=UPI001FE109E8|nr:MSHA biogenesis protein MshD [Vibrio sonorensis]